MAIYTKNANQILSEAYSRLSANTKISNPSAGSSARAILEIIAESQSRQYADLSFNVAQSFVSKAIGENLDLIGVMLGTKRGDSQYASDITTDNFRFKIDTATSLNATAVAGRINEWLNKQGRTSDNVASDNSWFTIKSGTRINNGSGITYVTTADATMSGTDTEAYVPVVSLVRGENGNVGPGALSFHNAVENQAELTPVAAILLCENTAPITNGSDTESDASYRYRLSSTVLAAETANETAIRLAALSVPGVRDISIRNFSRGVGTFSIFVLGTSPIVNQGTLNAVSAVVGAKAATGTRTEVIHPVYRTVELTVSLEFHADIADTRRRELKNSVKRSVTSYINNIDMAGSLVISKLLQNILSVSEQIRDAHVTGMVIGEYNTTTKKAVRRSPVHNVNQTLYWDEKFYTTPGMISVC